MRRVLIKTEDFFFVGISTSGNFAEIAYLGMWGIYYHVRRMWNMNIQQGLFRVQFHYRFTIAAALPLFQL